MIVTKRNKVINMNIKSYDKTIKEILTADKQYTIPRFQREYSWEKSNYKEFIEDMINCLTIKSNKIQTQQYFLGTMLFVGDNDDEDSVEISVVDGQQRLTTITILFSVISDRFKSIGEDVLSKQIFKYIMTLDDNGEEIRVLKSKTHYPFFSYFIQDRKKSVSTEPSSEEEECIKTAYDYFYKTLDERSIRNLLKKNIGERFINEISYTDILKAIRDQVLGTTFVAIYTLDSDQANMIFEILNAKGKHLTSIDLIKNKIFTVLNKQEPADYASEQWKKLKQILNSRHNSVGLATFYRHFWISKYCKCSEKALYDKFNNFVKPKNESTYATFLDELNHEAKTYIKIICPSREDFSNKKEYFEVVQILKSLTETFDIVQTRIAILALFDVKEKGLLTLSQLKKCLRFIENFHFAYNTITVSPTNKIEKIYSNFAIEIRKSNKKQRAKECIDKLIQQLDQIFPTYDEFRNEFIKLTYSKKNIASNVKTKYALNKINCCFDEDPLFSDLGSIEHVLSEAEGAENLNIGNLIILEEDLNREADSLKYSDKISIYKRSKYKWVQEFLEEYPDWNNSMIEVRAEKLSELYYTAIFGKTI